MKVFWFDSETGGLDPARHGIISLAFAVEVNGEVKEEGKFFSNCAGKEIDDRALLVNGMTREEIVRFPEPSLMYRGLGIVFDRYVDKYRRGDKFYAGGFNADFDLGFLRQLWLDMKDEYFGSWFFFRAVDPSAVIPFLAYAGKLPGFPSGNARLAPTAEYLGVPVEGAHEAEGDLTMTREVARRLAGIAAGTWERGSK